MKYSTLFKTFGKVKAGLLSLVAFSFFALSVEAQNRIYVSPQGGGDGTSWTSTKSLSDALTSAKPGDEIWLMGYEQITDVAHLYVAPKEGFKVPSGVKVFGGFEGTESRLDQRKTLGKAYQMTYRSVISGDIYGDDVIDPIYVIFPQNTSRGDNASHVIVMDAFNNNGNDGSKPTVIDGLTIVGGHAADFGGGVYVKGGDNSVPYSIERCYFINNYALKGGALYVAPEVKALATVSTVNQCVFYNNAAGTVVGKENVGGGIYMAGAGSIVNSSIFNNENGGVVLSDDAYLVNSVVARNTGAGVDMTDVASKTNVYNSVIWGNSFVSEGFTPQFSYSAYPESDNTNNNVKLSKNNRGDEDSPMFDAPSLKTSFDSDYDWRRTAYPLWSWKLVEGSLLINRGNNDSYKVYANGYNGVINTDLGGQTREVETIDINAYEFQRVPAARIRYVKTTGSDSNDGSSWDTAYKSVQKAIDDLAAQPGVPGEVWVAAGEYSPVSRLTEDPDSPASFRMYDGISVYGGFAGTESSKDERVKGEFIGGVLVESKNPWQYAYETVFEGTAYSGENVWNDADHKWTLSSGSVHVVWFAPLPGEEDFKNITVLDGVTIQGGMSNAVESVGFENTKGAGVYMKGRNVYLNNSIVKDNVSLSDGGGIYLDGGRVQGCLVYNNSSETRGGAIYMDNSGLVLRSMLTNNAALEGGAIYMDNNSLQEDGQNHPEYQILSTSVVSNNTSVHNGAVYCNRGGIILQTTITNNNTPTATDNADGDAAQTGGLYINEYAKVINSVLWNNEIKERKVQLYAKNPTADNVCFYYCAVANMNNIIWNNTLQSGLISLSEENITNSDNLLDPGFESGLPSSAGVDSSVKKVDYFWKPIQGSNLRARGMELGRLPEEVLVAPELDIQGSLFAQKPSVGAYSVEKYPIKTETKDGHIRIYVDTECTIADHGGDTWETAYRSLNEAIEYMAALTADDVVGINQLEIYVLEGDIWPRYAAVNLDPKSATIEVPAMASGKTLIIKGGYSRELKDGTCAPLSYRSQINGNHEGNDIKDGLYHCITVEKDAKVEFDGFHIINGYASGSANLKYGAGMLVRDGANVTIKNSVFENNTAYEGAAVDARNATLTMINCVVNNNTNTDSIKQVINCPSPNLTLNHVSVVNNIGAAPSNATADNNSFAVGNSDGNSYEFAVGTANFINPTKERGATLGYDTYLGGYSSFMPTNQCDVVNNAKFASLLDKDITGGARSRGGKADLGAYEAELPVDGTVIYVRKGGTGDQSGSSWNNACATIGAALAKAKAGQEIWVSAGVYVENIDMFEGVNVLGGFASTGNPMNKIDDVNRDISHKIEKFKTTIQGSEEHKFKPAQTNVDELNKKNKRVLTQPKDFETETLWEGFIITGGQTGLAEYGAGVKLMRKGHLKNCRVEGNKFYECGTVVYEERPLGWETKRTLCTHNESNHTGGGGVFCAGGIVENCQIIKNILDGYSFYYEYDASGIFGAKVKRFITTSRSIYGKGAGLSISGGDIINCVIAQNVAGYDPVLYNDPTNYLTNILGSAAFVQSQSNFYSSTIVENTGGWASQNGPIIPGVWDESLASGDGSYFYNCIIVGNYGYGNTKENFMQIGKGLNQVPKNLKYSYFSLVKFSDGSQTPANDALAADRKNVYSDFGSGYVPGNIEQYKNKYESLNLLTTDFELNIQNGTHDCLNTGGEEYLTVGNINITRDANGYNRIQDCAVDMGAYESANETNLAYETNKNVNDEILGYTYYVTQNGAGLRNGSSLANAACAMKLQQILTHAGQTLKDHPDKKVVVKIAGYKNGSFKYRANTLSNEKDQQSYTFVVPYGVTVMGGYDESFSDATRKPYQYQTVLSALAEGDGQDINGYHVITFGEPGSASGKQTVIDGLYLIEGKATSMAGAGNPNTRGGGAVVPAWAHVRNCVIAQCEAIQGGALYLMPGATVSGTLIIENAANEGAGVYADADGAGKSLRAHMISNTITDNMASEVGGGIYLEDGAVLTTNSVIWGNEAPSDKNVSGVVNSTFVDDKFVSVVGEGAIAEFYPFNHCYVETFEMPSNYENTSMESDETLYFTADRTLKAYSELVKHGTVNYGKLIEVFNVAEKDMQGITRMQTNIDRVDVGAYAFEGGIIPMPKIREDIVERIFVSQGSNVSVSGNMDEYIGRSFYTSVSWLDDAIDYIKRVRNIEEEGKKVYKDVEFEIYLAGGTYKPSNRRTDAATTPIDQRQNSYVIPAGVTIYGGFKGDERYGYGITGLEGTSVGQLDDVSIDSIRVEMIGKRKYSDLNGNGVYEPWEFENQSILSGDINVSPTVKNAYHVVYSSIEDGGSIEDGTTNTDVILDGVTIKDGETINELSIDSDELGRGGAIYTNGVNYVLRGCRIMNCKAVRGGAIYSRDADVTIMGSVIAGNGTVEGELNLNGQDVRGGAVYISAYNESATLKAVNTLWANNETTGKGGAIATSSDLGFTGIATVSLMNNTFVRNKASENSAIHATAGDVTNSVMWGGEGTGVASTGLTFANSASDGDISGNGCIKLNAQNMAIDGPRFAQPSETAGVAGNNIASKWNPASVSVLTDAGDGQLAYESEDVKAATGAYRSWFEENKLDDSFYFGVGLVAYNRYMGPKPLPDEEAQPKVIDMGVYEYQYQTRFAEMDRIYVDTKENGNGSGDSWANATSDLRGAIVALSNPTGGGADKYIYIKGGDYPQSKLYTGDIAYRAVMAGDNSYLNSLTIKGSYTENEQQDFSKPTRILPSTVGNGVNTLMYVKTNGKALTIEGLEFSGSKVAGLQIDNTGDVTLKNVAFRNNTVDGAVLSGKVLVANALFADGGTGIKAAGSDVTVVNATFANNETAGINGTVNLYNSVAWNSGNEIIDNSAEGNINLHSVANDDVLNGPNFVDPEKGNYMIRPSIKLLDLANNTRYTTLVGEEFDGEKDLANNNRLTGDRLDIGAYEYNAQLQPVVYVKANVVNSDGSGSSWENPISDLQSAIDLASIYANKNSQKTAYVFVHKNVKTQDIRLTMPRVKVYGGMNDEVGADAQSILNARASVLSDNMSTINGLTLAGESSVIDGFAVAGTVNVNGGMLSTSVVNSDATVGADAVVYNSYVGGTLSGAGKAVNVTSPNAMTVATMINVVENAQPNGYVDKEIWKYQLKENNAIDNGKDITEYITMAGYSKDFSKDLSGAKRLRGTVDAGCFETWNITSNETLVAGNIPTENHVVYVRKGVELDIKEGLYPEGKNFNVGFLLLEHGAGLRGNGNYINLTNFAVERNLNSENNYWDMFYMPFVIEKVEGNENVQAFTYDGEKRAAYDYKFSSTDGAWKEAADIVGNVGMMIKSSVNAKVRMYGRDYKEIAGQVANILLEQHNNMEPWSGTGSAPAKFTHQENMGWNMFGSPFLCAMNYDDMEYGRVIYKKNGDTYATVNTTADGVTGSIEAGSAVFTQTATLQINESLNINQRTEAIAADQNNAGLVIAVGKSGDAASDAMAMVAVPTEDASSNFNMAADGVKMMSVSESAAQIYIERAGKRYSLLSAVDIEGTVEVGLNTKEAGMFTISVPEECNTDDYETVVLTDKANGNVVDLLDASYEFTTDEAGDISGRFTIQFNRNGSNDGSNLNVYSDSYGAVIVEGLADGMNIRLYDSAGKMVAARKAFSPVERFTECESGVYLVQVLVNDGEPKVFKVHVKK